MIPHEGPKKGYPYSSVKLDIQKLLNLHNSVVRNGCGYKLGAKVRPINSEPGEFYYVDCSGYVDWLFHKLGIKELPDGSYHQQDAIIAAKFKRSTVEALSAKDGNVRIAFIKPSDSHSGIGHVALWHNGKSIESHGKMGPNRRTPEQSSWLQRATVYVLTTVVP